MDGSAWEVHAPTHTHTHTHTHHIWEMDHGGLGFRARFLGGMSVRAKAVIDVGEGWMDGWMDVGVGRFWIAWLANEYHSQ